MEIKIKELLAVITLIAIIIVAFSVATNATSKYDIEYVVTSVNGSELRVERLEDSCYITTEIKFQVGDKVIVTYHDNGTYSVVDDYIINLRKGE